MTAAIRLSLFGGFSLETADGAAIAVPLRKGEALLAYLGAMAGRPVARERLATLLWGESDQHRARQSLRQALFALTREFAQHEVSVLRMESQLVWLDPAAIRVDIRDFESLVEDGSPAALEAAAQLYTGDFLRDFAVDAPDFEDWQAAMRDRLQTVALDALLDLLAHYKGCGDSERAIDAANQALAIDACREDVHRTLMRLYVAKGMRSSALAQYRTCRTALDRELGVTPDDETSALYREILALGPPSEPEPEAVSPPPAAQVSTNADGAPGNAGSEPAARLAHLGEPARRLLAVAGAVGPTLDFEVLRVAANLEPDAMLEATEALVAAGVFAQRDGEMVVAEPSVCAALYENLLPPRRCAMHEAVTRALETVHANELESHYIQLSEQCPLAGRPLDGVRYQVEAGAVELNRGRRSAARRWFRRALKRAADLQARYDSRLVEVDALLGLAEIAELEQDPGAVAALIDDLEARLDGLDDPGRQAAAHALRSRFSLTRGDEATAYAHLRRALRLAAGAAGDGLWHPAECLLLRLHLIQPSGRRALDTLRRNGDRAHARGLRREEAVAAASQGLLGAVMGDVDQGLEAAVRAVEISEELADERCLAACLQAVGMIQAWKGDAEAALASLDKAEEIARACGDLLRLYVLRGHRGAALAAAKRFAEALAAFKEAREIGDRLGTRAFSPLFAAWAAEALGEAGQAEEALELAREAFHAAAEANQAWARSIALRTIARVLAQPEVRDLSGAEKAIRSALADQDGLGLTAERARSLIVHAKILRADGQLRRSTEIYAEASDLFRRMHMTEDFDRARNMAEALSPAEDRHG